MTPEEKAIADKAAADKVISDKAEADKAAAKKAALEAMPVSELVKMISTLNYENAGHRIAGEKAATAATEAAAAQKIIDDKAAVEKGEFKTLYEALKAEQEGSTGKVTAMTATLDKMLEVETANIPEAYRALIPQGDVMASLEWITTAKASKLFEASGGPGVRQPGEPSTDTLEAQHAEAMKKGDLGAAMRIKSQMRQQTQ